MTRRMERIVIYTRQIASVFALISAISAILFVVLAWVISSPLPQTCQMSYSKPRYARTILPPSPLMERLSTKYAMFTYTDGFARYTLGKVMDSLTIIVFFPGNVGSYKQIRSIASRIIRKIPEGVLRDAVEHYTFDFGEETSALSAQALQSQAAFASDALQSLVDSRMKSLNLDRSMVSIILIGHSMGGTVVSSLFSQPNFPSDLVVATYILGSPIRAPVLSTEFALHDFYQNQRQFWGLQSTRNNPALYNMLFVSISGGMNDLLVESSLSDLTGIFDGPNSISVVASQIPQVDLPVEHQGLVWCSELVEVLATSVISVINFQSNSPQERKAKRGEIIQKELSRFSYAWPRPVNALVDSQLGQQGVAAHVDGRKIWFDRFSEPANPAVQINIPDWEVISLCVIASTRSDLRIFGCITDTLCKPVHFSAIHNISSEDGAPQSIFILENLHVLGVQYLTCKATSTQSNGTKLRVWGTFSEQAMEVKRQWGQYDINDTFFDVISLDNALATDVFCQVSIDPVDCKDPDDNRINSFALITLDNAGLNQSTVVPERLNKEVRFYRTATVTKGINFFLVLDRKCHYKVSIVPLKMPSMLSTLFHDFAIIPQVLVAMAFFLLTIQLIQFHNWKGLHRGLSVHNIIIKYIPEIVIICALMSILLPFALNFRIPNRGPSASVPIPIPQSLWSLFAVCLLFLMLLSSLLEALLHPSIILRIALWIPLHRLTSTRSLRIIFLSTIPIPFVISSTFYSVVIGIVALSDFLSSGYRDANSDILAMPKLFKCSWTMTHSILLMSCIPRWIASHHPSPTSSALALIDFILFILTNWSFVLGPFILIRNDFKRITPIALITFGITLLLWAPRSIAIFPVITLFIWILAAFCHLEKKDSNQTESEIYLKLDNNSNKVE